MPFRPVLRFASCLALFSVSLLAASAPARAHPHIFIGNAVTFVFTDGKVTGFRANWVFDDTFSGQALGDFDADHDGMLNAAEIQAMGDRVMHNLELFHYFTYVWVDNEELPPIAPQDFHGTFKKGVITFDFLVPLPKPIDPRTQPVAVEIYDQAFLAEVRLREKLPVTLIGAEAMSCTPQIRDDKSRAYSEGRAVPQEISLACD